MEAIQTAGGTPLPFTNSSGVYRFRLSLTLYETRIDDKHCKAGKPSALPTTMSSDCIRCLMNRV